MTKKIPLLSLLVFLCTAIALDSAAKEELIITHFLSGTGFYVNQDGFIVTNNHVVQDCKRVSVIHHGREIPARITARDLENDLALVRANVIPPAVAQLRSEYFPLQKDEAVVTVGFPGEQGLTTVEATILDPRGPNGEEKWLQFTDSVTNGNSGGPLLDKSANVIGVVMAKAEIYPMGRREEVIRRNDIAISLPVLREFLSVNGARYRESNSGGILASHRVEDRAKEYIVNVRCVQ